MDMDAQAKEYIQKLYNKYKGTDFAEVWYCTAACTFAASNKGQYVADVFVTAISERKEDIPYHRFVTTRIKESILKTGIVYGIPRVINAFRSLMKVLPSDESNDPTSIRLHIQEPATTDERGEAYMRNIFRADLDPFLDYMNKYWPDLKTLVLTTIYGYYQAETSIVDALTTSMLNIATLVPMDVTAEVAWHMRGTIRNGGTEEQLKEVYDMTMDICNICKVAFQNTMPLPKDVIHEERLIRV